MITSYSIKDERVISEGWGTLKHMSYETKSDKGAAQQHKAELYNAGNAVAVLLYNPDSRTVLLNDQFRIATVHNGNSSGMMTEVCAGKIEDLSPDETVLKEIREETGYAVPKAIKVMSVFMSPGAYTERLELYVAPFAPQQKIAEGGGLKEEGEDITVREVLLEEALSMIESGKIIDAKTILLLQYAALHKLM